MPSDPQADPPPPRSQRDLFAALASGFVAALALATSLYNVYLQREQLRAAVLPRLTIQDWKDDNSTGFSVANRGPGPADVRRLRVLVDGKPTESWLSAMKDVLHVPAVYLPRTRDIVTMISAGQELPVFSYDQERYLTVMKEGGCVSVELCYCSTLGDCWELHDTWDGAPDRTNAVAGCPADPIPFAGSYTREQSMRVIDLALAAIRASKDAGANTDANGSGGR